MIAQIVVSLVFFVLLAFFWVDLFRKPKAEPAEIRTVPPKGMFLFVGFLLVLFTAGTIAVTVFALFGRIDTEDQVPIDLVTGFFVLSSGLLTNSLHRGDEALVGDMIVVRRGFMKEKRIPVADIKFIEAIPQNVIFYDANRKALFQSASMTVRLPELIKAIAARGTFLSIDLTLIGGEAIVAPKKEELDEILEEDVYVRLGRDYRARVPKLKRDATRAAWIITLVQFGALSVLLVMTRNPFYLIYLFVPAVSGITTYEAQKKKFQISGVSDRDLGLRFGHLDPRVVGSHRDRVKTNKMLFVLGAILSLMGVLLGVAVLPSPPPDFASFETVTGIIDTVSENEDGDVFIRLRDDDAVYRVTDLYSDGLYVAITDVADAGDAVVLRVGDRFDGTHDGADAVIAKTYFVQIGDTVVLGEAEVLAAARTNRLLSGIFFGAMIVGGAATILGGVFAKRRIKRLEQQETIRL